MSADRASLDFNDVEVHYDTDSYWSLDVFPDTSDKSVVEPDPSLKDEIVTEVFDWLDSLSPDQRHDNGPLVRAKDFYVEGEDLVLELQDTDFYSHIGTRDRGYTPWNRADPLAVGTRVVSSDDYLILGEKGEINEIGEEEFHLPAGYTRTPNPDREALNEVEEEIGLQTYDSFETHDLVTALGGQPMLTYDLQTDMSFTEIAEKWRQTENEELVTLLGIPIQSIPETITGEKEAVYATDSEIYEDNTPVSLRPHAEAALDAVDSN